MRVCVHVCMCMYVCACLTRSDTESIGHQTQPDVYLKYLSRTDAVWCAGAGAAEGAADSGHRGFKAHRRDI